MNFKIEKSNILCKGTPGIAEDGMEVFEFSLQEIEEKIIKGEINDAKTICAVHLAKNQL